VDVLVEKPAAGGRMIARHEGEIVLVAGAIPGERVSARVTRAEKRVAFADVVSVEAGSPDRRATNADIACGGCVYAHIEYARQVALKAQIIEDAFLRIGRIPLSDGVTVQSASEHGYRMRARFHVADGRAGFYREGTHHLCDPRPTGQLHPDSPDVVDRVVNALAQRGVSTVSVELSENIAATHRAVHVHTADGKDLDAALEYAVTVAGLTGATARASDGTVATAGDPVVTDPLATLTADRARDGILRRHPEAFFQGNRFLIGSLVAAVMDAVPAGRILDLYAGVGLFSVSLAAAGRGKITAVEGDPISGRDLERNAAPFADTLRVSRSSVEHYVLQRRPGPPDTLIVDPPRTGMSKEAGEAIARSGARRIVYVSCDAPTMARDARRLLDAGHRLVSLQGFDLFPNTAHVESLGVFEQG
jgi:23S rRNA (uracil1939-C5)-methyltransferase